MGILHSWLDETRNAAKDHGVDSLEQPPASADSRERTAPVDAAVLAGIKSLDPDGTDDAFRKVVDMFLLHTPQLIRILGEVVNLGDTTGIAKTAHSLTSSCAMIGALHLAELCRQMERRAHVESADGRFELQRCIEAEFSEIKAALMHEIT